MAAISDRDKKLIYILLTAMIICLPYFFFIKDKKVETAGIKTEVQSLNERYQYLLGLEGEREQILADTKKHTEDMEKLVSLFPSDIEQAKYTLFLLQAEYSSDVTPVEGAPGYFKLKDPIRFNAAAYGTNKETPIASDEADTGLVALTNSSDVSYVSYYGGLKHILKYLLEQDPMVYTSFTMDFDETTGTISGEFSLSQFAVKGEGRPAFKPAEFNIKVGDKTQDVSLDGNKIRGNKEIGVFGEKEKTALDKAAEEAANNQNQAADTEAEEDTEE